MSADPLRVLIAESGTGYGGTAKYLAELVAALRGPRYDVHVAAVSEGPFIVRMRDQGVPVHVAPAWRFQGADSRGGMGLIRYARYAWRAGAQLPRVVPVIIEWLRRHRIEIVHLNNEIISHLPLLIAAHMAGCRTICHLHNWRLLTGTERWAARFVDFFICISDAGARYHAQQLRRDVLTILNGLHWNGQLTGGLARRGAQRTQLQLDAEHAAVMMLGRLVPWKGYDVFLRALAGVMARRPGVRGFIVGHDPSDGEAYLHSLRALARQLGIESRVTFLPWQDDVWALYAAADLVVHASIKPEPFGLVILEAMAAGRAVIATNGGGVTDLVLHGVTGVLVPPNDDEQLALAIDRLVSNRQLAARLGRAAQQRATTLFTIERNAAQVAAVYDELAGITDHQLPITTSVTGNW